MDCTTRLKIGDINKSCICVLCGGYIIDATTIIECLHSFCRTCIVTYLKTSKNCPVCDTLVHKTRPHQNIRSDKLLQDLVYKLVPGLYKDEMRRRREFYTKHYEAAPKRPGEERGDEMSDRFAYTDEEKISLSLHFCPEGPSERVDFRRVFSTKEDLRGRMEKRIQEAVDVRYLQCKAAVTIGHLKKFVRLKYGLPPSFQVDMFYNDEPLRNSCTLCDVAYYFNWTRRAPLMMTFCVFESTKQTLVKECPHVTTNTSLDVKSAPGITATTSKQVVAVPTEPSKVETSLLFDTTMVPTEIIPPPNANVSLPDVQAESTAAKNNQTKVQSFSPKANSSGEAMDQNHQCPDPRNLPAGSGKAHAGSVKRPPGPSNHPPKTKPTSLGKRPAPMPVLIAPAPAKVAALDISLMKNHTKPHERSSQDKSLSTQPTLVSFFPSEISQQLVTGASHLEHISKSRFSLNFSVSSVPGVINVGEDMVATCRNSKQPSAPVFITASCSSPSTVLSSHQLFSNKPKQESSVKTFICAQNQLSRHLEASTSTLSSCTSTNMSSTLTSCTSTHVSSTLTSSDSVSIMQSSSSTAVASPTPASSASPTPAAIPSQQSQTQQSQTQQSQTQQSQTQQSQTQQSQTQGLDMLHSNTSCFGKQTETTRKTSSKDNSSTLLCHSDQKYILACKPETSRSHRTQVNTTPTNVHYEHHNRTPNCAHQVTNGTIKREVSSVTTSQSNVLKTEPKSLLAIPSTAVSSSHSIAAKGDTGSSSATCSSSNGTKIAGAACVNPKQNKQKKIADIANTLHKRVSEALLSMVTKHANSSNNRRPSVSLELKSLSNSQTPSNLQETAIMNALSCQSLSVKQSIQNMPPDGRLLTNGTSTNIAENNHSDEPLNLVKRDREMTKFINGMFILDIPPSVT